MSQRLPISKRSRFEIFKRDGFACQYCGKTPPDVVLHVDHIIPVAEGGCNDPGNLATACSDCNLGKGAVSLDCVPASLEAQHRAAEERREQAEAYALALQEERYRFEEDCWSVAEILSPGASEGYSSSKFRSVKMFVRKIGFGNTREAAEISADRWPVGYRRFKYFCGVCWRMARELDGDDE